MPLRPELGDDTADGLDPWRLVVLLSGLLVLGWGGLAGTLWLVAVVVVLRRTRTRRAAWRLRYNTAPRVEQVP